MKSGLYLYKNVVFWLESREEEKFLKITDRCNSAIMWLKAAL